MKLKQQIILLIGLSLVVPAILITSISIYKIKAKADADIEQFRSDELEKLNYYRLEAGRFSVSLKTSKVIQ